MTRYPSKLKMFLVAIITASILVLIVFGILFPLFGAILKLTLFVGLLYSIVYIVYSLWMF